MLGRCLALAAAVAGCGRLRFDELRDATGDSTDALAGHDEDGDGIPDTLDNCPHLPNVDQADTDGDGVGDVCDPYPAVPTEHIALFSPMLTMAPFVSTKVAVWSQGNDVIHADGTGYGELATTVNVNEAVVAAGLDLIGSSGTQQQVVVQFYTDEASAHYYGELYDMGGAYVAVTYFDGTNYTPLAQTTVPVLSFGPAIVQLHVAAPPAMTTMSALLSTQYDATGSATNYTGGTNVSFATQGLVLDIKWLIVIATN